MFFHPLRWWGGDDEDGRQCSSKSCEADNEDIFNACKGEVSHVRLLGAEEELVKLRSQG